MGRIFVARVRTLLFFVLVMAFGAGAYAQSQFAGVWAVEMVGQDQDGRLEIASDHSVLTMGGTDVAQAIVVDADAKTIVIPALNMIADRFDYVANDDGTVDLFVKGKFNIDIAKMFGASIGSNVKGKNSVTVDALSKIAVEIEKLMHDIPLIRLRPLHKIG